MFEYLLESDRLRFTRSFDFHFGVLDDHIVFVSGAQIFIERNGSFYQNRVAHFCLGLGSHGEVVGRVLSGTIAQMEPVLAHDRLVVLDDFAAEHHSLALELILFLINFLHRLAAVRLDDLREVELGRGGTGATVRVNGRMAFGKWRAGRLGDAGGVMIRRYSTRS